MIKKRILVASIIIAFPFVLLASYLWFSALDYQGASLELYWFGEQIYKLGLPLTGIILYIPSYMGVHVSPEHDIILILLIDSLFFLQWIIWGHFIFFLKEKIKNVYRRKTNLEDHGKE